MEGKIAHTTVKQFTVLSKIRSLKVENKKHTLSWSTSHCESFLAASNSVFMDSNSEERRFFSDSVEASVS